MLRKQRQKRANNTGRILIFLIFFFIAAIVIFIYYPTDKKRIRKVIAASEKAIVQEDLKMLMENVSYNYRDDYGNSYLILKKRMQALFSRLDDIEIERDLLKMEVNEKSAEVDLGVRVIASEGASREYIIGDVIDGERIKVYFEKSPYLWKITRVDGLFDDDS